MEPLVWAVLAEQMDRHRQVLSHFLQQVAHMAAVVAVLNLLMKTVQAVAARFGLSGAQGVHSHQLIPVTCKD
jgi:hypothetical protein